MNRLDKQYQELLQDILANGVKKEDRTGTGTISVFGRQIRHKMSEGFPLLTTKKMPFKTIVTELLWFLQGSTNIKYLVDNGCNIWNGDAYKNYKLKAENSSTYSKMSEEEFIQWIKMDKAFANEWGELGPIYGKQWRKWTGNGSPLTNDYEGNISSYLVKYTDQIQNLINDLKTNPDSRRLMVNAWNVGELDQMVLPPCHYGFQVYTRELSLNERDIIFSQRTSISTKGSFAEQNGTLADYLDKEGIPRRAISLMWNQRSVDTFLGLPFNIASYGLLLEIIAREVNMVPDELIGNLGDVHLYSNHIEQAKEQIGRERTHEDMVEIYNSIEDKKDSEEYWTWETRFEDNNITRRTREPFPLPALQIMDYDSGLTIVGSIENWGSDDFVINNYQSHPAIKAPLSN